ncbi:MAG: hypothetical protein IT355_08020 [Gemmatimonadaceae bacterium]|nr:hypothetical protein [Gemmatimonadaceae bacterium]
MKPSKPFVRVLALTAVGAAVVLLTPQAPRAAAAHAAATQDGMPLSTKLTPEMIDYFGLGVAFERPSVAALVACHDTPACGASDSSTVRFTDASGAEVRVYDGMPASTIEQVRRVQASPADGVTETRILVRHFSKDAQGRLVMSGTDSIVKVAAAGAGRAAASTVTRVNRYTDVRYLVNDPRFPWPITGLVVLELSDVAGMTQRPAVHTASHAAVSFDGTAVAQVLTTGALSHRANLQDKRLETVVPDR